MSRIEDGAEAIKNKIASEGMPSGVAYTTEFNNRVNSARKQEPCRSFVPTLAAYEWCPGEIPETCDYCSLRANCPLEPKQ